MRTFQSKDGHWIKKEGPVFDHAFSLKETIKDCIANVRMHRPYFLALDKEDETLVLEKMLKILKGEVTHKDLLRLLNDFVLDDIPEAQATFISEDKVIFPARSSTILAIMVT